MNTRSRAFPAPLRGIRAAFVFLTRIPVGGFPYRAADYAWASAHAPLVGFIVGGLTGGAAAILAPLGALPASFLALGVSMLATGAFHEDGLADTSDALGGASDRDRLFAILKDSRIGSFGAAALVVSIGTRATLLAELGARAPWAMALAGCCARVAPIWLLAALPYVSPDGAAKSHGVARGGPVQAVVATLWGVLAVSVAETDHVLDRARSGVLALTLLVVAGVTGARYRARAGGVTGDLLGATEQLGEVATLAALAWGVR